MPRPEVYYIEDSNAFFEGQYSARREYSLKLATSLKPDDNLERKMLDFSGVALRLGKKNWSKENSGILTFNLNLKNRIVIPAEGPIPDQIINTLHFSFAFKRAKKDRPVGGIANTPIFRRVSVRDYLTKANDVGFSLEFSLAKSGGSNANTVVDLTSRILSDPAVSGGLIANLPVLGIASAVFAAVRTTFFNSGQARTIWDKTLIQFKAKSGIGCPLKIGRYVFASTKESIDKVENFYRYRGGRLVDIRKKNGELKDVEQFYLDIYAY
jgi:hypothetical protein